MSERTALYRFWAKDGSLLYVGISLSFMDRFVKHRCDKPWFADIHTVTVSYSKTREEAIDAERNAIKNENPRYNKIHAVYSKKVTKIRPTMVAGVSECYHNVERAINAERVRHAVEVNDLKNKLTVVYQHNNDLMKECKELRNKIDLVNESNNEYKNIIEDNRNTIACMSSANKDYKVAHETYMLRYHEVKKLLEVMESNFFGRIVGFFIRRKLKIMSNQLDHLMKPSIDGETIYL